MRSPRYTNIFFIFSLKLSLIFLSFLLTKFLHLDRFYKKIFFLFNCVIFLSLVEYNTYNVHITFRDLPVIILFIFGYDWGRWMHILYSFSILLYFYMVKSSIITNNFYIKGSFWLKIFKKKIFLAFVFFIFAFFWNPKTVITGDIASNTGYKIIYNTSKKIFNFGSIRLFQDNPLIKLNKKFFE